MLVFALAYLSTLKMEAICSSPVFGLQFSAVRLPVCCIGIKICRTIILPVVFIGVKLGL
jgi:hypothetical protein